MDRAPDYLTTAAAAALLGVGGRRVRQIRDRLGGFRVGHVWAFPRDRVEAYRDRQKPKTEKPAE